MHSTWLASAGLDSGRCVPQRNLCGPNKDFIDLFHLSDEIALLGNIV